MIDLKALPSDVPNEQLVLGAMLTDPEAVPLTLPQLTADDFTLEKHKRIWLAIEELHTAGEPIDYQTTATALRHRNQLESVDGLQYLMSLENGLPQLYALDSYVRQVKLTSVRRRVALALARTAEELCQPGASVETVQRAEEVVRELSTEASQRRDLQSLKDHVEAAGGVTKFLKPSRVYTAPIPWSNLRATIPGFGPGRLYIVAARPAAGKSIVLAEIALHGAERGIGAGLYSLEMSADEMWRRMIASRTGIELSGLNTGDLDEHDAITAQRSSSALAELPLWIDDQPNLTVPAIVAGVRKARAQGRKVGIVLVDYLQLVSSTRRRDKREQEVSEISRSLKLAAKELKVPIVAACQMSRDIEKENREPRLSDLRESGAIEQDADVVWFLHRDPKEVKEAIASRSPIPTHFLIRKQRNGPTGRVVVHFHPNIVRFEEPA